jgi:hypothetical protein
MTAYMESIIYKYNTQSDTGGHKTFASQRSSAKIAHHFSKIFFIYQILENIDSSFLLI